MGPEIAVPGRPCATSWSLGTPRWAPQHGRALGFLWPAGKLGGADHTHWITRELGAARELVHGRPGIAMVRAAQTSRPTSHLPLVPGRAGQTPPPCPADSWTATLAEPLVSF